jgi:hypothetical protein
LPCPHRDERALLLGKRGKEVEDERVNIRPKFSDQERHLVCHEAAYEVHITAQAIQSFATAT